MPALITVIYTHASHEMSLESDFYPREQEMEKFLNQQEVRALTRESLLDSSTSGGTTSDYSLLHALTSKAMKLLGNYQHLAKQIINTNFAIGYGRHTKFDWLFHIDTDELLLPSSGDIRVLVDEAMQHNITSVRLVNLEAQPESADIVNEFLEISLFKNNPMLIPGATRQMDDLRKHLENNHFFLTYANGKSGARLFTPGLQVLDYLCYEFTIIRSANLHKALCRLQVLMHSGRIKETQASCPGEVQLHRIATCSISHSVDFKSFSTRQIEITVHTS